MDQIRSLYRPFTTNNYAPGSPAVFAHHPIMLAQDTLDTRKTESRKTFPGLWKRLANFSKNFFKKSFHLAHLLLKTNHHRATRLQSTPPATDHSADILFFKKHIKILQDIALCQFAGGEIESVEETDEEASDTESMSSGLSLPDLIQQSNHFADIHLVCTALEYSLSDDEKMEVLLIKEATLYCLDTLQDFARILKDALKENQPYCTQNVYRQAHASLQQIKARFENFELAAGQATKPSIAKLQEHICAYFQNFLQGPSFS